MSSSQPDTSSIFSCQSTKRRRKSRFTFRNLSQLGASSAFCPLRVTAHLDLDAFYAQCEMVRLAVPEDKPLAVQQWQGLIAINYPARKYGLSRHVTIAEAQAKCPDIILQHVATWKEGDEYWAYHDDAHKHIATHKVSLDPYRLQSRKILALIKNALPLSPIQKVEKASIDEVFLDLSAQVHSILLQRFPELQGPPPYDDPTEHLPAPPANVLDWNSNTLIELDAGLSEADAYDWDDIAMFLGSEIIRAIRSKVRSELGYTCSAGIASNKMLAKLGSGHRKPNQQTVIRNRAVQRFLGDLKFTKIRMLGGKLGDEVVGLFNTDTIKDLLEVPLEQFKTKMGNDTGLWLYQTIRGEDHSEVNPRTQIKSMLSAKSFRPTITSFDQAVKWLRIFVADIFSRLVEEGVTENKRRPKTINLHHRQGGQTRSKQTVIPAGSTINENLLLSLAKDLLAQVIVEGRAWPCSNLSLSVGGFEDGVTGNRGIGSFLVRGEEAKAVQRQNLSNVDNALDEEDTIAHSVKRRRNDPQFESTIGHYFGREVRVDNGASHRHSEGDLGSHFLDSCNVSAGQLSNPLDQRKVVRDSAHDLNESRAVGSVQMSHPPYDDQEPEEEEKEEEEDGSLRPSEAMRSHQTTIDTFFCSRCQKNFLSDQQEEHDDWHFAKELQEQDQQQPAQATPSTTKLAQNRSLKTGKGRGRPLGGRSSASGPEKGQQRLAFN